MNKYNINLFPSNSQNQGNYHYIPIESKKTPPKAVVYDKPEKIKLKYLEPTGFKLFDTSYTEAITKAFNPVRNDADTSKNYSFSEQQNDYAWKPFNNLSNRNLKPPPFQQNNFESSSSTYTTKNLFNDYTTIKPFKQSQNTYSSIFSTSSFSPGTVSYEATTTSSTTNSYTSKYDDKTDSSKKATTKPSSQVGNNTVKQKPNQSNINRIKLIESNTKHDNNTSKKAVKYSSKYKEEVPDRKPIRKLTKQGSTTVTTISPKEKTDITNPSSIYQKGRRKYTTDSSTRQPTRSRMRQNSTTTSSKGKNRQVTKNRNNVNATR